MFVLYDKNKNKKFHLVNNDEQFDRWKFNTIFYIFHKI